MPCWVFWNIFSISDSFALLWLLWHSITDAASSSTDVGAWVGVIWWNDVTAGDDCDKTSVCSDRVAGRNQRFHCVWRGNERFDGRGNWKESEGNLSRFWSFGHSQSTVCFPQEVLQWMVTRLKPATLGAESHRSITLKTTPELTQKNGNKY